MSDIRRLISWSFRVHEATLIKKISISNQNTIHPYLDETLGCRGACIRTPGTLHFISSVSSLGLGFICLECWQLSIIALRCGIGIFLLRHCLVFASPVYEIIGAS